MVDVKIVFVILLILEITNSKAEETHSCTRLCDGRTKICYYEFFVEHYATMGPACATCPNNATACLNSQCVTADGVERHVMTFNRQLPGPSIQVCVGDTIVVDVHNKLLDGSTTIHWHGIRQKGSQFYDGVPYVTQCPINPGTTFRYIFKASNPGTYFYHSHIGLQKVDGLSGPMVVRQSKSKEFFGNLYDYDLPAHVLYVTDWMHIGANEKFPGYRFHNPGQDAVSYLLNGKGVFIPTNGTVKSNITKNLPLAEFIVQKGKTYRFRIIGATCLSCMVSIKFYGHRLTLISADSGGPISPTVVDTVMLNSGDRFDVLLTANRSVDSYWIHARGRSYCKMAQQFGILRYLGHKGKPSSTFPSQVQSINIGKILNTGRSYCDKPNDICIFKLKSPLKNPETIKLERKKEKFFLDFNLYSYPVHELFQNNVYDRFWIPKSDTPNSPYLYLGTMSNISNRFPPSPLLSQYHDIPKSAFCPKECYQQIDTRKPCACLNIIKVSLNSEVTMVIVDYEQTSAGKYHPENLVHPFHLHGHNFYVLEQGRFNRSSRQFYLQEGSLKRRLEEDDFKNDFAIEKDVVSVPTSGYAVIRWIADNPGFWFIHCHFTYHVETGMAVVVQVGELEEMPPVPKGFPECSNYLPPVKGML